MGFVTGPNVVYPVTAPLAANLLIKEDGSGNAIIAQGVSGELALGVTFCASDPILSTVPVAMIEGGTAIMSILAATNYTFEQPAYSAAGGMVSATPGGRLIGTFRSSGLSGSVADVFPNSSPLQIGAAPTQTGATLANGAGSAGAMADVGGSFNQATLNTNFATLVAARNADQADIAAIIAALKAAKLMF